jgi:hypothetical protein
MQSLDGVKLRGKANMKFWESWKADKNFVKEWGYRPVKVGRECSSSMTLGWHGDQ